MSQESNLASPQNTNRTRSSLRQRDRGYLLVAILFMLAIMAIALTIEAPRMVQQIKRDREEEMIRRGTEYARAIKKYYKKFGRYPANLEQLDNTNQIRFLRQHYKDPLTKDGKWKLLNYADIQSVLINNGAGAPGVPAGALGTQGGQNIGQPASGLNNNSFGANSALGTNSAFGANSANPQQQAVNANGVFGNGQQPSGTSGISTGNTGQPSSGDASQTAAGQASSPFGNNFSLGSNNGNQGSPGFNSATPGTNGSPGGSNSSIGNSANQVFGGGAIVGVASVDKDPTIRIFNKKKTYNEWMFIYDPTQDRNNVLLRGPYQPQTFGGAQGQQLGTPAGQLNGQQNNGGFGQNNSNYGQTNTGLGQSGGGAVQPQQPQQPQQ